MAKQVERTPLDKKNYTANFTLRGAVVFNDTAFTIDAHSEKSDWVYNRMSIGVNCGAESGTIYAQMMGGYGVKRDNIIYVHGKDENGKDDFSNSYTIDWEDRNDPNVTEDIGDLCFITVAVEKTTDGRLDYKKFLSEYDAIKYCQEALTSGTEVSVYGNISYQDYNDSTTMSKDIKKIIAVDADEEKRHANITQTILLDRDSLGDKNDHGTYDIYGYVLEKMKVYKGHNLATKESKGGQLVPLRYTFEFALADESKADKMFKFLIPKKKVTQVTFTGKLIEGGSIIKATIDDLDDDIKEYLELGLMTEEQALADCAGNNSRERRVVFESVKSKVTDSGQIPLVFKEKYDDSDLELFFDDEDEIPEELVSDDSDDDDEFNELFG